jgi:hypothetical protein
MKCSVSFRAEGCRYKPVVWRLPQERNGWVGEGERGQAGNGTAANMGAMRLSQPKEVRIIYNMISMMLNGGIGIVRL